MKNLKKENFFNIRCIIKRITAMKFSISHLSIYLFIYSFLFLMISTVLLLDKLMKSFLGH